MDIALFVGGSRSGWFVNDEVFWVGCVEKNKPKVFAVLRNFRSSYPLYCVCWILFFWVGFWFVGF